MPCCPSIIDTAANRAQHAESGFFGSGSSPSELAEVILFSRKRRAASRRHPARPAAGGGASLDHRFHEAAPMSGIHLGDEAL